MLDRTSFFFFFFFLTDVLGLACPCFKGAKRQDLTVWIDLQLSMGFVQV